MRRVILQSAIALILLFVPFVEAAEVSEREGSVYFAGEGGEETKLTSSGLDTEPALSSDQTLTVTAEAPVPLTLSATPC
jgi:hypothetical protein